MKLQEIERKFLVKGDYKPFAVTETFLVQGYLSTDPERSVRVRITGAQGFITVKGAGTQDGCSRFEWEKEISLEEARALLLLCLPGIIRKTRYRVPAGRHVYEVDAFGGDNAGLTIAEIELSSPDEPFEKPAWLGREVTGETKYYNAALSKLPFNQW